MQKSPASAILVGYNARMMRIGTAFLLTGLLCCALPRLATAGGEPEVTHIDPPSSVLFTGNSLTFYNNAIYTHLRKLLVAKNPANRRGVFLKSMTISGARVADHRGGLAQMLESRDWDVVVLQGQSREAIDEEMAPGFRTTVEAFSRDIRQQGAEPVLFMTWAYAGKPEMLEPLSSAFTALGNEHGLLVIPVGLAFQRAIDQVPGVSLHQPDTIHPSLAGTYLAAAVFYSALFGESPEPLEHDTELDPSLARQLRQIAWEATQAYYGSGNSAQH
jgi:hypothetical protein